MRLINSDSQVEDVLEVAERGTASKSSARIEMSALLSFGMLAITVVALAFAIDARSDTRNLRDLVTRLEETEKWRTTEDRVQINHMMEMEATQKVLQKQVEELKHGK